jgi:predicted O-linked N-acetylglucosamine transferase (SPINDLY family)
MFPIASPPPGVRMARRASSSSAGDVLSPKAIDAYSQLIADAEDAYSNGQLARAVQLCLEAMVLPEGRLSADLHLLLGAVYFELRDYNLAISSNKKAHDIAPKMAEPLANIGNCFREQGMYEQAFAYYEKAIECNPTFADVHNNKASLLVQLGRFSSAIDHFRRALELNPIWPSCWTDLGNLYRCVGQYDQAYHCYQFAVQYDPMFLPAWMHLGFCCRDLGMTDFSIYALQQALRFLWPAVPSHLLPSSYLAVPPYPLSSVPSSSSIALASSSILPSSSPATAKHPSSPLRSSMVPLPMQLGSPLQISTPHAYPASLGTEFLPATLSEALPSSASNPVIASSLCGALPSSATSFSAHSLASTASLPAGQRTMLAEVCSVLATLFKEQGSWQNAVDLLRLALSIKPECSAWHSILASVYHACGMVSDAVHEYSLTLQYADASSFPAPLRADALNNLGNALKEQMFLNDAISCYRAALQLVPTHIHALNNLGNAFKEVGLVSEALSCYQSAVQSAHPGQSAAPLSNMASLLKEIGQVDQAFACFRRALEIDPHFVDAHSNFANALKECGRVEEAIVHYQIAVALNPQFTVGFFNLANAMKDAGRVADSIPFYQRALSLKPDLHDALCNMVHAMTCVCCWQGHESLMTQLKDIVSNQLLAGQFPSVQPFHALTYDVSPQVFKGICEAYADRAYACAVQLVAHQNQLQEQQSSSVGDHMSGTSLKIPAWEPALATALGRLRIGYVSSDFGNHPLSHLMQSVFRLHDRAKVEVFCYSLSFDDGSTYRAKIASDVEHFLDVSRMPIEQLARLIASHGIQVLINLNGYTKGARNELFAMQPAPVQCMYMGFPGTSGAKYVQYYVTDAITTPPELGEVSFSEHLVRMPHSYFVCDHKQSFPFMLCTPEEDRKQRTLGRAQYGLDEHAIVFGMFNQLYKVNAEIFDVWCRILQKVPNSVLWLLRFPAAGESYLRAEAAQRGIEPRRIFFTDVTSKDEHIRRGALLDIFLDTPLCNGHTTGTDILWAGTPMITCPQKSMASRVAAGLLHAMGVPELITDSLEAYESLAVELGLNASKRNALRAKMCSLRTNCALFDTARWTRNFERGCQMMYDQYQLSGANNLSDIDVPDVPETPHGV